MFWGKIVLSVTFVLLCFCPGFCVNWNDWEEGGDFRKKILWLDVVRAIFLCLNCFKSQFPFPCKWQPFYKQYVSFSLKIHFRVRKKCHPRIMMKCPILHISAYNFSLFTSYSKLLIMVWKMRPIYSSQIRRISCIRYEALHDKCVIFLER